jgi:hypothetical protein
MLCRQRSGGIHMAKAVFAALRFLAVRTISGCARSRLRLYVTFSGGSLMHLQ